MTYLGRQWNRTDNILHRYTVDEVTKRLAGIKRFPPEGGAVTLFFLGFHLHRTRPATSFYLITEQLAFYLLHSHIPI